MNMPLEKMKWATESCCELWIFKDVFLDQFLVIH